VELLVPELQKRGLYWNDYAVPGGTFRENVYLKAGQRLLPDDHHGAKLRWNAKKLEETPKENSLASALVEVVTVDPVA